MKNYLTNDKVYIEYNLNTDYGFVYAQPIFVHRGSYVSEINRILRSRLAISKPVGRYRLWVEGQSDLSCGILIAQTFRSGSSVHKLKLGLADARYPSIQVYTEGKNPLLVLQIDYCTDYDIVEKWLDQQYGQSEKDCDYHSSKVTGNFMAKKVYDCPALTAFEFLPILYGVYSDVLDEKWATPTEQ